MAELVALAKWIGGPGSAGFFVLCCVLALIVARIGRKGRTLAKVWTVLVCAAYVAGALPVVSYGLANRLPSYTPIWTPTSAKEDDLLVIFSGDNPAGRAREARRVLDVTTPRCVIVSGGQWFVRMVVAAGVERGRLTVDDSASTTREQVAKIGTWAEQCGAPRVILIASILSMPRISALVQSIGTPTVLVASPLDAAPARSGIAVAVPSLRALRASRDTLYEHFAFAYYRRNQWIP